MLDVTTGGRAKVEATGLALRPQEDNGLWTSRIEI